jgi:CRP-like cAMP-binding protein
MAQTDSNPENDLNDLAGRVKSRLAAGGRRSTSPAVVGAPAGGGLKPSEILFMSSGQKNVVTYLSHQRYASAVDIQQAVGMERSKTLEILSGLKDEGYIHEVLVGGEIMYRVKFADTSNKNNNLPKELWNALSLDNAAFLKKLPLFANLSQGDLNLIAAQFKQERYERNDVIMRQGETAKSFFIIKTGMVAVSNISSSGSYNLIRYLEQDDFFGETGLLTGQNISATITAFTPVDILEIGRDSFYKMLNMQGGVAVELARTLAQRLASTTVRLANKLSDASLFLVVNSGKRQGANTVANAMALAVASSTPSPTAYVEFSGKEPSALYGFPATEQVYAHPGGFKVINQKSGMDVPELAQAAFVLDQAGTNFKNLVICISWELLQKLDDLMRSAAQIIVVTSPDKEDRERTQKVISSFKTYIRADKTRIFTVVNHTAPNADAPNSQATEPRTDFEIPFLESLPPIAERRMENLPKPLADVVTGILSLLGYTNQVGVYLPTTIGVDQQADTSAHVEKTLAFMGKTFGGATHETVQGVWNSQEAGLVEESIHLVRSYCSQPALDKRMGEVVDYVETLKQELQQEAMALEVNHKLMLI